MYGINQVLLFWFVVNDTLDDMLNESGDEEEQDAIVNQVLDEIGIEISGKVGYQDWPSRYYIFLNTTYLTTFTHNF